MGEFQNKRPASLFQKDIGPAVATGHVHRKAGSLTRCAKVALLLEKK
jgi:hypothetical protein